jgi:glycosyltransferase involved in cell wall biosynthesis
MHKITAFIPTFNESHNIEAVIKSVQWCDEILVVDSFSTDNTVELAKQLGARVLQSEYINSASQKNRNIPHATHPWILLVDADERVTPELRDEIQLLLQQDQIPCDAYWIKRKNFFMGSEIKYSGWQGDKVIRFFKRDSCRYEEKSVHAEIITSGIVGQLTHKLEHHTYKDIFHYMEKWDRYTTWSAQDAMQKYVRPGFFHFVIKPTFRFIKHYFLQLGILDGKAGYIISSLSAKAVFMRYVKVEALRRAQKTPIK